MQVAAGQRRLRPAVRQVSGIAGQQGDQAVIAVDPAGLEDVDDGLPGLLL
jgi:hypothetical protein